MEHVTDSQLNAIDTKIARAKKHNTLGVIIDTRLARDLIRELRRLRDMAAIVSQNEGRK